MSSSGTEKKTQQPATPDEFELTLEEFCLRLSREDDRVELVNGFYAYAAREGHMRDTHSAFLKAFHAWAKSPVTQ